MVAQAKPCEEKDCGKQFGQDLTKKMHDTIREETDMYQMLAAKLRAPLENGGLPGSSSWAPASSVAFCSDWRDENRDPGRQTQVRMLWSPDSIFLRFDCSYREIFTYSGKATHRDQLWMRDVAEVFIRPDMWDANHYLEFEISPNGDWLDLDIAPGKKSILFCDLKSRVLLDRKKQTWTAEMAIPMSCLTQSFKPHEAWRLNFFRIEGREPNRFYSAWVPTFAPQPNFHVPEVFGVLHFLD